MSRHLLGALSFALLGALALGSEVDAGVNPIRKVVGLLENLQKEIEEEGVKEQALFDNFMCFCDNGSSDLLKTANEARAQNKAATSQLEASASEKSQLESDIKQHEVDLAAATSDLDKALNIRSQEEASYSEEHSTKSASAAALGKAIPAIEKGMGGGSLLQFVGGPVVKQLKRALHASQQLTQSDRQEIVSFLSGSAPGSGEILGMLKAMKDELTRDLDGLEKGEASAVDGFNGMKASKEKEIEFADESIESKKERVGTLAVTVVQLKDEIEDSAKEAGDAEKFAATLDKQCAEKKKEWATRTKERSDEIAAVGECIAILTDDDALDVFKKAVPASFVQGPHVNRFTGQLSFLQSRRQPAAMLQKAQAILSSVSAQKGSMPLGMILYTLKTQTRLAAKGAVDFTAITKMIDEMVAILSGENKDDIQQKDFCIKELEKTEREKAATDDKLSQLTSSIEEITDNSETSAQTIANLQDGVHNLDRDVAQATEQRKKEHAEYVENVQLSETALALMAKAKNRLQKFYNPSQYKAPPKKEMTMEEKLIASGSSALMQQEAAFDSPEESFVQVHSHVAPPEAPAAEFGGKKSEKSGGIMALMDMLMGDLKTSLQEAQFTEKQAQKDYVELMQESQEKRQQDGKSIVNEQATKAELEGALTEAKESQHLTMEQLENVHSTIAKLHGSCDFIIKNWEVRQNARTAEIEGLKNAKAVLAGANFSL